MAVGQADTIFARHDPKVAAVGANDMLRLRIRRACLQDVAIRPFEVLRKLRFYEIRGGTSEHGVRREIVDGAEGLIYGDVVEVTVLDADGIGLSVEDLFRQGDPLEIGPGLLVALLLFGDIADGEKADTARQPPLTQREPARPAGPFDIFVALPPVKRHLLGDPVFAVRPVPAGLRQGSGAHAGIVDRPQKIAQPRPGNQHAGGHGEKLQYRGAREGDGVVPAENEQGGAKRFAACLQNDPADVCAARRHIIHRAALVPATAPAVLGRITGAVAL